MRSTVVEIKQDVKRRRESSLSVQKCEYMSAQSTPVPHQTCSTKEGVSTLPQAPRKKRTLHCLSFLIGCPTLHPNAFAKSSLFESGPITRKLVGE